MYTTTDGDEENESLVWYNSVVRSEETVILFNLGGTSAGLDIHLYSKSDMAAGSVSLCQGVGGQKVSFPGALKAEDDLALLASTRECTKNGVTEKKEGDIVNISLHFFLKDVWTMRHLVERCSIVSS